MSIYYYMLAACKLVDIRKSDAMSGVNCTTVPRLLLKIILFFRDYSNKCLIKERMFVYWMRSHHCPGIVVLESTYVTNKFPHITQEMLVH